MRGNLKIKRGLRDMYAQNTMCEPCLDPDSSKTNTKKIRERNNEENLKIDLIIDVIKILLCIMVNSGKKRILDSQKYILIYLQIKYALDFL